MTSKPSASLITCAVCGFRFDPEEHPGCSACPLHVGCATACCPNCGASNINPQRSRLARLVERLLVRKNNEATHEAALVKKD
jgi:hypothetical protein